jgi:hypothetical protein
VQRAQGVNESKVFFFPFPLKLLNASGTKLAVQKSRYLTFQISTKNSQIDTVHRIELNANIGFGWDIRRARRGI